ncbi:MAG: tRNA (adenosine(37)-N6)-dimethylallyltransferase MiaA [Tannerellaceae bacterium]|jgi:tRNA dimethylallyltransferase|nr:tRNA (adenosine(37)-N6)-dimethylallyltransferase MiaA [Tannerellaceae bacterium]
MDKIQLNSPLPPQIITILGPTASGKTAFAASLASRLDAEIISADSRQVYRSMDIGTGKDMAEYTVDGHTIPTHLIDICEAGEKYNLHRYQHDFFDAYMSITARGKLPILCGGTGMYIEAAINAYNLPDAPPNPALRQSLRGVSLAGLSAILASYKSLHNTSDLDSTRRAIRAIEIEEYKRIHGDSTTTYQPLRSHTIGLTVDRDTRRRRITERLYRRIEQGMIDEVRRLLASGISPEDLIYYGLEYKYITLYLTGRLEYRPMLTQLETAIHQFAKRQMTWFRGMEKRGTTITWQPQPEPAAILYEIQSLHPSTTYDM